MRARKPAGPERAMGGQHRGKQRGFASLRRCRGSWPLTIPGTWRARRSPAGAIAGRPKATLLRFQDGSGPGKGAAAARAAAAGSRVTGPAARSRKRSAVSPPPMRAARRAPEHQSLHAAGGGGAVGAGDRQGRQQGDRAFVRVADTPEKMLALGEARVPDAIKTIGLYRGKAKNVIALSQNADRKAWRQGAARPRGAARRCPASAARPPMWC